MSFPDKNCSCCHKPFTPTRKAALYCSDECKSFMLGTMKRNPGLLDNIPTTETECRSWVDSKLRKKDGSLNYKLISHPLLTAHTGVDVVGYVVSHNDLLEEPQAITAWLYDIPKSQCVTCGADVGLEMEAQPPRYKKFCSEECQRKSMKAGCSERTNLENAISEKYGVANTFQLEEVKQKSRETVLKKYGVDHPMKSDVIKDRVAASVMERYGVSHVMKMPEVRERVIETWRKIYGVDHPMFLNSIIEKRKKTCVLKYGVDYPLKVKAIWDRSQVNTRIISKEKYGVSHYFSSEEYRNSFTYPSSQNQTQPEIEICSYLDSLGVVYESGNFSVLRGKMFNGRVTTRQIDIYCPEHKLAIEFNGLYWHSEKYRYKDYHLEKTMYCEAQGIQLIHIWEDEWVEKQEVVKSLLKAKLGIGKPLSYARQHTILEGSYRTSKDFLDRFHIQGGVVATDYIHLVDKTGNIQAVMLFTKRVHGIELVRFASNNCHGAFSRLLKYYIARHRGETVYSFGDRCVVSRLKNVYLNNGFVEKEILPPDYKYVTPDYSLRIHKFNFRKEKFLKLGYDIEGKTEDMLAIEAGLGRIWGCGLIRYELEN